MCINGKENVEKIREQEICKESQLNFKTGEKSRKPKAQVET